MIHRSFGDMNPTMQTCDEPGTGSLGGYACSDLLTAALLALP
jgi:hypothetical protein